MINVSALIGDLGPSQKSFYLIKAFNELSRNPNLSCTAFVLKISPPYTKPLFSCSSVSFLSNYNGVCLATNLEEAQILLKSNNNSKKYLYLWDMEWIKRPMNYSQVCDILLDDRLSIISRSDPHSCMIENYCNKPPIATIQDWNPSQILEILEKTHA